MGVHRGIATTAAVGGMIVLLVVGLGAGYLVGSGSSAPSTVTKTVTSTVQGTAATTTVTTSAGPTLPAGLDAALAASCKAAGGQATIYTTEDQNIWNPYSYPMLQQIFPWFTVNFVGLGSGDVVTKGTAEYQAGHVTADVLGAPQANLKRLVAAGAVQQWTDPEEKILNYPASFLDPNNYTHPMWQNPILPIYNTNLVKDLTTLPKSWPDFANPIWKGKLAFNNPSTLSTDALVFATLKGTMDNASWYNFMNGLKANSPLITSDAGGAYTDVSTGQAAVGIALFNDYNVGVTKAHAPVALINLTGPIYVSTSVMGLAKNAPHPACGQLLIQYMSGTVGQTAIALGGNVPSLNPPQIAPNVFKVLPAGANLVAGAYNQPTFFTNGTIWANLFQSIFGQ